MKRKFTSEDFDDMRAVMRRHELLCALAAELPKKFRATNRFPVHDTFVEVEVSPAVIRRQIAKEIDACVRKLATYGIRAA